MGAWGALIMGFFGAVFAAMALIWQTHLPEAMFALALALPALVYVGIALAALRVIRLPGTGITPTPREAKAIQWSSFGEGLGLFVVGNLAMNLHHPELLLPAMALIVGLHFLPIARAGGFRPFYALGTVLILAAIAGALLPAPLGSVLSSGGAAAGLWIAAIMAIVRDRRAKLASY